MTLRRRFPARGNSAFPTTNQIVLADERVSRRHALIHSQGEGEFWLVDLGSRNGTYVNDRRVQQPVRLRDGDRLRVGGAVFVFRQPGATMSADSGPTTDQTMAELRPSECWLLVADVVGSTQLARNSPPDEMAMLMGGWLRHCKQLIEAAGGTMNKYLGDGFLAFWHVDAVSVEPIAKVVEALRELQQKAQPPFRFVLHCGKAFLGGEASLGEEGLTGLEVNFVSRMEELASSWALAAF